MSGWTAAPVAHSASSDDESNLLVARCSDGRYLRGVSRHYYGERVIFGNTDPQPLKLPAGHYSTEELIRADLFDGNRDHALREYVESMFQVEWLQVTLTTTPV